MFLNPIGLKNLTDKLTNLIYNQDWKTMVDWWNDHDRGSRQWMTVSTQVLILNTTVFIAAGNYTATPSDMAIVVNKTAGAATTVTLPASPVQGRTCIVKDGKGDAAANNITVQGAAGTVDGAASYVMAVNYRGLLLLYNGTEWNKVSIF